MEEVVNVEQFKDREIAAKVTFFQEVKEIERKSRREEVGMMELLRVKRALRGWIQTRVELDQAVEIWKGGEDE